jgi:outer membrane immunogenic protein
MVLKATSASHTYTWTGVYAGMDGGWAWTISSGTLMDATGTVLSPYSYGTNGPFAGGFIGFNYQLNRIVLGVEGDWQRANLTGNDQQQAPLTVVGAVPGGPYAVSTTIKDYESIRGRLGFSFDRFLVYATAGWTWSDPSVYYAALGSPAFASNSANPSGWTAGVGVEYAITDHVTGRLEYRYAALTMPSFVNAAENASDTAIRLPINDMRVGVAYRFGGGPLFSKN